MVTCSSRLLVQISSPALTCVDFMQWEMLADESDTFSRSWIDLGLRAFTRKAKDGPRISGCMEDNHCCAAAYMVSTCRQWDPRWCPCGCLRSLMTETKTMQARSVSISGKSAHGPFRQKSWEDNKRLVSLLFLCYSFLDYDWKKDCTAAATFTDHANDQLWETYTCCKIAFSKHLLLCTLTYDT